MSFLSNLVLIIIIINWIRHLMSVTSSIYCSLDKWDNWLLLENFCGVLLNRYKTISQLSARCCLVSGISECDHGEDKWMENMSTAFVMSETGMNTAPYITMTSQWARWRLNSPVSPVFYSTVYSGAYQRKHQSSASLAFVWGIHRWPVNCPHKWPVTRNFFPFDDVIM